MHEMSQNGIMLSHECIMSAVSANPGTGIYGNIEGNVCLVTVNAVGF